MDEQKEKMDDLASLFLPDLLHPLSTITSDALVKQEDDGFHAALFQNDQPKMPSYSAGMNMQMVNSDHDHSQSSFDPDSMYTMNMATGPTPNHMANYTNQGPNMRFSPHPGPPEDFLTHTSHYQEFVPAEAAGIQPPSRYHSMQKPYLPQHVMPFQPAWSASTVIGQFDGMNYYGNISPQPPHGNPGMSMPMPVSSNDADDHSLFGVSKTATPEVLQAPMNANNASFGMRGNKVPKRDDSELESSPQVGDKSIKKQKKKPKTSKIMDADADSVPKMSDADADSVPLDKQATPATIQVDYNPGKLLKLLDLDQANDSPQVPILDHSNQPVQITFRGFIAGRFYTNDQDNFNHISATKEVPQTDKKYNAEVVSCYRRNFIHVNVNFSRSSESNLLAIPGKGVINGFRLDVLAFANGEESIPVILNTQNDAIKDKSKGYSDVVLPKRIGTSHKISVSESGGDNYFTIRRAQFKSATANSVNVSFQTFNNFSVRLIAELDQGEVIVKELKSSPIIVRGRNPSFYHKRGDVLIRPRPAVSKSSFEFSEQDVVSEETRGQDYDVNSTHHSQSFGDGSPEKEEDSQAIKAEPKDSSVSGETEDRSLGEEMQRTRSKANRQTPVPTGAGSATNLKELLDPKSFVDAEGKPTRYRYFPISNVYYLPPINVVYFPHRAHHQSIKPDSTGDANVEEEQQAITASASRRSDRKKPTSKFYFR
ncbi:hypothetical protein FT663_00296 [Candidozyma haemuli var. vulneris]|uniref:NDT80 domain-containing protein n=1 Tax=Candidozyma haemuli TaxID=45357 RepID=A0A2V1ARW6_9ASCO|nr:hypothetical protein CXQ85_002051 [[Candida] haemuloni]KAF3993015.1 hypothetical protein FT662_00838 [[Candida] haemuloni var. vulneris]KAF3995549.1 hypothetical protein FT663_00296 [[Candida] haemuloni var. vulneris]PVH20266.1 hypothetical protein CXQ85_002051 [[Candida] haemuloni]